MRLVPKCEYIQLVKRSLPFRWEPRRVAAPYLVFEHQGSDQGTAAEPEHVCAPSPPLPSWDMVTNRCPREEVGCFPPVVSETTFATFRLTPRYECGGTTPNMSDAAVHDPARQVSTFFGHIARAGSRMDHTRSIISGLPRDWKRLPRRPRRTWLRTIEQHFRPLNIGLMSAWKRAQDRERWKRTVETARLQEGACSWWWWWRWRWWYLSVWTSTLKWADLLATSWRKMMSFFRPAFGRLNSLQARNAYFCEKSHRKVGVGVRNAYMGVCRMLFKRVNCMSATSRRK